ncbi:MAG: arsenate reductase [Gemmatimonadota bacterium]|jgi:arsenate reductase-like glutaredoxin family protein|nr:arsenate reductase [Gemmatimonadota bacterium]
MTIEVQVFGTRKCKDTQKALRFFKERRVKIHHVDLEQRAAAGRELERFARKFGVDALLDREGRRFRDKGLHVAHLPESRILPLLEEDPLLLRTPLVRAGAKLSIGHDPAGWAEMVRLSEG